jgi:hypothetical protein
MGMVVHPVLRVGTICTHLQSIFESLKSLGTELVRLFLLSIPMVVLLMNGSMRWNNVLIILNMLYLLLLVLMLIVNLTLNHEHVILRNAIAFL